MPASRPRSSRYLDSPYRVSARVVCCALEFDVVFVSSFDNFQYVLTSQAEGVDITTLREGQAVECLISAGLPRVLSATCED